MSAPTVALPPSRCDGEGEYVLDKLRARWGVDALHRHGGLGCELLWDHGPRPVDVGEHAQDTLGCTVQFGEGTLDYSVRFRWGVRVQLRRRRPARTVVGWWLTHLEAPVPQQYQAVTDAEGEPAAVFDLASVLLLDMLPLGTTALVIPETVHNQLLTLPDRSVTQSITDAQLLLG